MRRLFMSPAFVVSLLGTATIVVVLTFITTTSAAQQRAVGAGDVVAARIGGRPITMADVDRQWQADAPVEYASAMQALYAGRKAALQRLIGDALIARAAESRGEAADRFAQREIAARVSPIAEDDVTAFYAANHDRLDGRTLEEMRQPIREMLERQQRDKARSALIREVNRTSSDVRVMLDPPRHNVHVGEHDPAVGRQDAPITIVAFSDFQCPFCARVEPTLQQVRETYGGAVRIVWKDFPLTTIHPDAFKAAEAGRCAAEQEQYWAYHERLFANQRALGRDALRAHATEVGLDLAAFTGCLDSGRYAAAVRAGLEEGARLGVEATPTMFVNGRPISGAQPFEVFAGVIDEELARR